MDWQTIKNIIDDEFSADDGYSEIVFDFFGGEPFTNFPLIQQAYEYLHSQKWPKKFICFATTNGVLVQGEIKNWLEKHKQDFWCSLSVDGTREMHNLNRSNSFDSIDTHFFQRCWPKQPIKMTISRETLASLAEGIIFLQEQDFLVTSTFAQGIDWSNPAFLDVLNEQLAILARYYLSHPEKPLCTLFSYQIERLCFEDAGANSKWCGCGESMKTYTTEGKLYPCQCFTPLAAGKDNAAQYTDLDFKRTDAFEDADCKDCPVLSICPTCYGSNYLTRGQMNSRDKSLCKLYRSCIVASAYLKSHLILKNTDGHQLTDEQYLVLCAAKKIQQLTAAM